MFLRHGRSTVPVPDSLDAEVLDPRPPAGIDPSQDTLMERVDQALSHPVGEEPLHALCRNAVVTILASDGTRETGIARYIGRLRQALGSAREVRVIVAGGRHRRMADPDVRALLGPAGADLPWRQSVAGDRTIRFVPRGCTRRETPVLVHEDVASADLVVATGAVDFHYFAGFSGGGKAIVPGAADEETIARNHRLVIEGPDGRHPGCRPGVLDGNPVHEDLLEAARLACPRAFLVNTVLRGGACWAAAAGDIDEAHRRAVDALAGAVLRVPPRDLVLLGVASPRDASLLQAHKALELGIGAARPGGVVILMAECSEGVGHPEMLSHLLLGGSARILAALRARFRVYGQTALSLRRKAETHRIIIISGPTLDRDVVERAGIHWAASLEQALQVAGGHLGRLPPAYVVPDGAAALLLPA